MQVATALRRSRRLSVVVVAVVVAAAVFAAVALSAVISQRAITDTGNVHLRVVRTLADGFDSGWHVHPGVAIVQVQEGSFQIYQGTCSPTTVAAGQTFIEVPHLPVRAIATGRVNWTTTLITSGGDLPQIPLADYANDPHYNPCPSLP